MCRIDFSVMRRVWRSSRLASVISVMPGSAPYGARMRPGESTLSAPIAGTTPGPRVITMCGTIIIQGGHPSTDEVTDQDLSDPDLTAQLLIASHNRGETDSWLGIIRGGRPRADDCHIAYPGGASGGVTAGDNAQLIYQHTHFDKGADQLGRISFAAIDEIHDRLGARLARDWLPGDGCELTTRANTRLWNRFGADAETIFATLEGTGPTVASSTNGGTWSQFRIGLSSHLTRWIKLFAAADHEISFDSVYGHSLGGWAGVSVV